MGRWLQSTHPGSMSYQPGKLKDFQHRQFLHCSCLLIAGLCWFVTIPGLRLLFTTTAMHKKASIKKVIFPFFIGDDKVLFGRIMLNAFLR